MDRRNVLRVAAVVAAETAATHTPVTVLAVGAGLAAQPELGRRIVAAGHELGNHTQHHADIKRMNADAAYAEVAACAPTLRRVTGSVGRWFRPSQTPHATATIKAAAAGAGYPVCLSYDVDSLDYTDPGADADATMPLAFARRPPRPRPGLRAELRQWHGVGHRPAHLPGDTDRPRRRRTAARRAVLGPEDPLGEQQHPEGLGLPADRPGRARFVPEPRLALSLRRQPG